MEMANNSEQNDEDYNDDEDYVYYGDEYVEDEIDDDGFLLKDYGLSGNRKE